MDKELQCAKQVYFHSLSKPELFIGEAITLLVWFCTVGPPFPRKSFLLKLIQFRRLHIFLIATAWDAAYSCSLVKTILLNTRFSTAQLVDIFENIIGFT